MDAIRVQNVTKFYRSGVGRARVREMLPPPLDRTTAKLFPKWWGRDTFKALDSVELTISPGTSVGLVGHNGAGKTTLLKVISRVTFPDRGEVRVNGRIAALIDALVGFHPDLTGRENVFLLGAMNGMSRKQMLVKLDRILDFAEIEEMIDTPVKRFSAGMMARLGFAVTASLDPAILLVDEILAVGDANFQRKCIEWLDDYRKSGGTLLFVSHNLGLVRSMTERVAWIDHGRLVEEGTTTEVLASYAAAMERRSGGQHQSRTRRATREEVFGRGQLRWGTGGARVDEVHVQEPEHSGEPVQVHIAYEASDLGEAVFCVGFIDEAGNQIGAATSPPLQIQGSGIVNCMIDPLPLRTGIYFPVVAILSTDGRVRDHWKLERAVVVNGDGAGLVEAFGPFDIASNWTNGESWMNSQLAEVADQDGGAVGRSS